MLVSDRPSLLYIFSDQQRADTMSCYGNSAIETPALNRLADRSFVFDNCYVSQPVCSPARATMLAGLYPHTARVPACNVPLPDDVPTIAELVDSSYERAYFGKWHLGDEIFAQHGFTHWVGSEDSYRRFYSSVERHETLSDYHHFLVDHGLRPDSTSLGQEIFSRHFEASLDEPLTKATFLGDRAAQFIHDIGDAPFLACVSYLKPRPPHTGAFDDHYEPESLPVGPAFNRAPGASASLLTRVLAAYYQQSLEYGIDLRSDEGWRALRARYWGNVTLVDRSIGTILDAIEATGRAADTIVVFTSDHGEMAGDHGILGKTVLYEESVRVPLLVSIPGQNEGQTRVPGNVSHIELVPTLLELLDAPRPAHLQGVSRAPVLAGRESLADNDVVVEWNGADGHPFPSEAEVNPALRAPWRSIATADRYKLNLSNEDQSELFDLNDDPHELHNLYDDPAYRDRASDLTSRIKEWQRRFGDDVPLPAAPAAAAGSSSR